MELPKGYKKSRSEYISIHTLIKESVETGHLPKIFLSNAYESSGAIQDELKSQIHQLKSELDNIRNELDISDLNKAELSQRLNELVNEINIKEKINHILPKIHPAAQNYILNNQLFLEAFKDGNTHDCVVVSIDIRRSTELMLKSKTPELFSKFITQLSHKLSDCIINNLGIFDKFTGDGILAFFPKFYSGDQAIMGAILASLECHKIFVEHYENSRTCFNVIMNDLGLGIGIDYGKVSIVNYGSELTVVGSPVVYACRLSGAKAGDTLLNQGAFEELDRNIDFIKFSLKETELDIKYEGKILAYKITNAEEIKSSNLPDWLNQL